MRDKLLFSVVASLVIFGLSENAHAVVPTVVSAEITGHNTITVTYSIPVISAVGDYTNLVLSPGGARAIIGHGGSGTNEITLTFNGIAAPPGTTATMDIDGGPSPGPGVHEAVFPNNPLVDVFGQAVSNGQGSHASVSKCEADCSSPTLGIIDNGNLYVENGFSYNGNPVNVDSFFTHYPLITSEVGRENVATFKIYDDRGPQSISHFALAFGIGHGKIFSDSKAIIEWDKSWNGQETLNVIDPENSLDNVKVVTSTGSCKNVLFGNDCLIIKIYHTFRETLDFNIVGTYYWDAKRNAANNYFNDGIKVLGDSLNAPKQFVVMHEGYPTTITEFGKNVAYDDEGNMWTFNKYWEIEYQPIGKIDRGISSKGVERNNVRFESYLQGQNLLAEHILKNSVDGSMIKNNDVEESVSYDSEIITRNKDIKLQNRISNELERASDLFSDSFIVTEDDELQKYWKIYYQFQEKNS